MGLFTKKSIAELQGEATSGALRRTLGPMNLTMLGIGAIIGTGIFVLTGTAAAQFAGPALVISMIIAGIGCALAGLCYAEFASLIPVSGSAYTYAYATLGELFAWIIGWDLILEYGLSAATVAVGWSGYATGLLHSLGITLPPELTCAPGSVMTMADGSVVHGVFNVPATLVILAVMTLLVIGIRASAMVNAVIVVVKVLVLLLFVAVGAMYVQPDNWQPFIPENTGSFGSFGWSGVLRGAGVIFFAYIGFDAVSTAAQEAKNPQRDMPIGILASLGICTVLFIAVALVLTGIVPYGELNVPNPIAVGIESAGVRWLSPLISVGALAGISSVMLVLLLGQTRVFYSMSRDGLLPPVFRAIHPRFRTPHLSTLLTGSIAAVIAGAVPITVLSQLTSMGTLLAFVIVCVAVLMLRRTAPDLHRPFRTPWMPWAPILGALICFAQMAGLPWQTWERLLIWLALGFVVYFAYSRRRAREAGSAEREA
ncbi:MAG TPA: amino acid permease [Gemmatimonadaceae bacterium]|jgi:APA family basic amino acid/polyamine antiporter|nr:amino acid permease [Gemmatimonadaceae bacterium]